ncbi:PBSX family phage terminase large subunit [uncultured Anaerococcus sp.]|uniref:PBSX family phage terminase large subunit n=1 Tax=uncultured Anaerococcus sp. TaxID=293428 RepID=UPI0026283373|nr:PBSX family phage terminase large subunit [uncultured Anaerococcus sp.]
MEVKKIRKRKTIPFNFSKKHKDYIRACKDNTFNFAEGAIRAGKTVDNVFAFAQELKTCKDRIHLATGSTVGNAKLNIGDANGFGLEYIFRGQCRRSKYKDNEALVIKGISTGFKTKIVIFAGGGKADSYKRIRGNSYGMWIATEINLHHVNTIKEAFNRTAAAINRKFFWDLNPSSPDHFIYSDYIDKYQKISNEGKDIGGYNYQHFTIDDNINISKERINEIKLQYDPNSVWYKRDIEGLRIVAEGLVYKQFANTPEKRLLKDKPRNLQTIQVGVDFGGNNSKHAFVATGFTRGFKEVIALASVKYEPDTSVTLNNQLIDFVREVQANYGKVDVVYADNAEQVLIKSMQKALINNNINIKVRNSIKNEIIDRIRLVNSLIATDRFFYTKDCETLVDALSTAVYKENEKKKEDERLDDGTSDIDTLDAFEYSIEKYLKILMKV